MTYENLKDSIVFKLVNKERNAELLKTVPYKNYLDMAVIFYYVVKGSKEGEGTTVALIKNEMLQELEVDVDTLFEDAIENNPRLFGLKIRGIFSTIANCLDDDELRNIAEIEDAQVPMYVATNNMEFHGAGVMLYKDALPAFAEKLEADLFVIPSSIHEVILIKIEEDMEVATDAIKDMIYSINRCEVPDYEVLSDSLYRYTRETDTLEIVM